MQVGVPVSFFASCGSPVITLGLNDRNARSIIAVGLETRAKTLRCTAVNDELDRRVLTYRQWTPKQQNYNNCTAIAPNVDREHHHWYRREDRTHPPQRGTGHWARLAHKELQFTESQCHYLPTLHWVGETGHKHTQKIPTSSGPHTG